MFQLPRARWTAGIKRRPRPQLFAFFLFFFSSYLPSLEPVAQEGLRSVGSACIAQRGVDPSQVSFGGLAGVIFAGDSRSMLLLLLKWWLACGDGESLGLRSVRSFRCLAALCGFLTKSSLWVPVLRGDDGADEQSIFVLTVNRFLSFPTGIPCDMYVRVRFVHAFVQFFASRRLRR